MPTLPILYSFRRCPYAMRARLALAVSAQRVELREVLLRDKPAELLRASPKGTVPVLVLTDGQVIEESLDIMLWALAMKDPERWMQPPTGNQDEMLALVRQCDETFKPCLDRYKYPERYGNVDALEQRALGGRWLMTLEERLQACTTACPDEPAGRPSAGLFGARSCLADAAIMPFVRQFAQVDRQWFDAQAWPALHTWLATWLESSLFDTVMVRHAPWQEGQGPQFP